VVRPQGHLIVSRLPTMPRSVRSVQLTEAAHAVAGHDDAPAYVAGADRAIAHVLPLLSRERG
jgi:hypothetical protein